MNAKKLLRIMAEMEVTRADVCAEIGCSNPTLGRKLNGTGEFKQGEIQGLVKLLNLSPREMIEIFFQEETKDETRQERALRAKRALKWCIRGTYNYCESCYYHGFDQCKERLIEEIDELLNEKED